MLLNHGVPGPAPQAGPHAFGKPLADSPPPANEPAPDTALTWRTGWHGRRFVLPDSTIGGAEPEPPHFIGELADDGRPAVRGDVERWRAWIGRHCPGQSRLLLAVSAALAAPCAALVGDHAPGGLHLVGDSATGKGLVLKVAASVFGGPADVMGWATVCTGLEPVAAAHSDLVLILSDPERLEPAERVRAALALLSGSGKARMLCHGDTRIRLSWRLSLLSAGEGWLDTGGEIPKADRELLAQHIVEVAGDAGRGFGVFDGLGAFDSAAALARHLNDAAGKAHGALGRAWLAHLTARPVSMASELRERMARFRDACTRTPAGDIERGAIERFALLGAAGEAATDAGLTGWPAGQAMAAALVVWGEWIGTRRASEGRIKEVRQ